MAVLLPAFRLCLLLLNLYGTFKVLKPPPVSQRNTRNGQGPSVRAMQLRKREMKSRLAVWTVWAIFSTLERPLDNTIGFLIPFYNEIKCTVLLFLIVSRSHGAEAIFLHLIHPLVRPYVPEVDNMLATLQSIFDLVTLIIFLPWEYVLHWWHQWSWGQFWSRNKDFPNSREHSPDNSDPEDREVSGRRLRPRNKLRQVRMREADRQTQVIFQEIEDAQDIVRTRAKNQFAARNKVRTQPIRATRNTDPNMAGLRTRKRVLDHSNGLPEEANRIPGSRSTGVHHLDPTTISQLAQGPAPQQHLLFPNAPTTQPVSRPSSPILMPTPSSSSQSSHEIWYPPQSVFQARTPKSTSRTPSPIYPPLPSAYRFTPRRSDPLPPPAPMLTPPDLVTPTPRRVSTGATSRGAVDAYEGIDQFLGPSTGARLAESSLSQAHEQSRVGPEDFRQALESSIQTMDVDTETLSTRDGSSANEESMEEGGGIRSGLRDMAETSARDTEEGHGSNRESVSDITRSKRKAVVSTGPVLRSARTRRDRSSSIETDEFGFTIRQNSRVLNSLTVDSSSTSSLSSFAAGSSRKKPLARTKPALKTTQEEGTQAEGSDEESIKKRRKLKPRAEGQLHTSEESRHQQEVASRGSGTRTKSDKARRSVNVQRNLQGTHSVEDVLRDRQAGSRVTRASTKLPLSGKGPANVIKRDRGK